MKLFYCKIADMEEWLKGQSHIGYGRTLEHDRDWMVNMNGVLVGMTNRGFREMCFANPFYFINYKVRGEDRWTVYLYNRSVEDLHKEIDDVLKRNLKEEVEITEVNMIPKSIYYSLLTEEIEVITKTPRPCIY